MGKCKRLHIIFSSYKCKRLHIFRYHRSLHCTNLNQLETGGSTISRAGTSHIYFLYVGQNIGLLLFSQANWNEEQAIRTLAFYFQINRSRFSNGKQATSGFRTLAQIVSFSKGSHKVKAGLFNRQSFSSGLYFVNSSGQGQNVNRWIISAAHVLELFSKAEGKRVAHFKFVSFDSWVAHFKFVVNVNHTNLQLTKVAYLENRILSKVTEMNHCTNPLNLRSHECFEQKDYCTFSIRGSHKSFSL